MLIRQTLDDEHGDKQAAMNRDVKDDVEEEVSSGIKDPKCHHEMGTIHLDPTEGNHG